jgi:hypothetical protein
MMLPEQPLRATRSRGVTPQLVLGVMVIVIGGLMTLDNLELIQAERFLRFWPVGLIALGLVKLWHARQCRGGSFSGILLTTVGTWMLLEQTALVLFGGFLVWQGLSGPRVRPVSADDNTMVTAMAVLGSVVRGNNSPAFRGGELTAVLGGCELDLRHAAIEGDAVIEVFALWGGIEIRVPDDWTVVSRVTPILAGVEDKTRPPHTASRHRLVLRGFLVMAGLEIKN